MRRRVSHRGRLLRHPEAIVRAHRGAIRRLAERLLAARELDAAEVAAITTDEET